jgi:hypothetical protein
MCAISRVRFSIPRQTLLEQKECSLYKSESMQGLGVMVMYTDIVNHYVAWRRILDLRTVEGVAGAGFCCARNDGRLLCRLKHDLPSLSLGFVFEAGFFPLRSNAVFSFLSSIRFCSKLGSSRYSCKAPTSDTGA